MTGRQLTFPGLDETASLDQLWIARKQRLHEALAVCGIRRESTPYRLAMLIHTLPRNNGQPVDWTNARIAADQAMRTQTGKSINAHTVTKAARALIHLGILTQDQQPDDDRGIRRAVRSINHARVLQLAESAVVPPRSRSATEAPVFFGDSEKCDSQSTSQCESHSTSQSTSHFSASHYTPTSNLSPDPKIQEPPQSFNAQLSPPASEAPAEVRGLERQRKGVGVEVDEPPATAATRQLEFRLQLAAMEWRQHARLSSVDREILSDVLAEVGTDSGLAKVLEQAIRETTAGLRARRQRGDPVNQPISYFERVWHRLVEEWQCK